MPRPNNPHDPGRHDGSIVGIVDKVDLSLMKRVKTLMKHNVCIVEPASFNGLQLPIAIDCNS